MPLAAMLAFSVAVPSRAQDEGEQVQAQGQDRGQAQGQAQNVILADARKRGVEKCIGRIENISNRILGDANVGGYVVVNEDDPDDGIYTAMVSRQSGRGGTQMVSLSVSSDENCTATYDITSVWGAPCPRIAQKWFPNYEPVVQLPGNVAVRSAAEKQQVHMVPLPNGCMTIQKEVVH